LLAKSNASTLMLCSGGLWAVYPALIVLASPTTNPLFLATFTQACSAFLAYIAYMIRKDHDSRTHRKMLHQISPLLCLGLLMSGFIAFSYAALSGSTSISSLIIIELWPIFAFFLFPVIIRNSKKAPLIKAFGSCLSLFGAGIVAVSQSDTGKFFSPDIHLLFAIFAAICTALGTLLISRISGDIGGSHASVLFVQLIGRLLSSAILSLILLALVASDTLSFEFNSGYLVSVLLAFIVVTGSLFFAMAVMQSRSPLVLKMWGIQPLFSVCILLFIGAGELNWLLLSGTLAFVIGLFLVR